MLKKHKSILHQICDEAVIAGFLKGNPVSAVRIQKTEEKDDDRTFLTLEQANEILSLFKNHPLHGIVFLTLVYGLRRSEVLGLKWNAVNFDQNTIRIKHTVVKNLTIHCTDNTKSQASNGTYEMLPEVRNYLLWLKNEVNLNRQLFDSSYIENDYVFKKKNGELFRPDYVTRAFTRTVKKTGFGHITFHALRHSTANILYDRGWEVKDIQTWMRHKQVSTTLQLYVHISKMRKHIIGKDLNDCFKL